MWVVDYGLNMDPLVDVVLTNFLLLLSDREEEVNLLSCCINRKLIIIIIHIILRHVLFFFIESFFEQKNIKSCLTVIIRYSKEEEHSGYENQSKKEIFNAGFEDFLSNIWTLRVVSYYFAWYSSKLIFLAQEPYSFNDFSMKMYNTIM